MTSIEPEAQPLAPPVPDQEKLGAPTQDTAVDEAPEATSVSAIAQWYVLQEYQLVHSAGGKAYAVDNSTANPTVYRVGSPGFASAVRRLVYQKDPKLVLKHEQLTEIAGQLEALAELKGEEASVWLRVAQTDAGIELDIGDGTQARISVGPGAVRLLRNGSTTLFERNPNFLPFEWPAEQGDIKKLLPHLNLPDEDKWLLIGWITYTLAHAKIPSSNYVILVLRGDRGSGKSTMCNVTIGSLVGPSVLGVQAFPNNQVDLAIAVQNAHVVMYDNLRKLTPLQADNLCRCSTAASLSTRKKYSDGQDYTHLLHGALVLNGIHPFIDQADLAQRCLTLNLLPLPAEQRTTEKKLRAQFKAELPAIFRGILDLIADIMTHLPNVAAKYPERMLEFVYWLAAMEKALGLPEGQLQKSYTDNLIGAMRDSLHDIPLADAVLQLAQQQGKTSWVGTPANLLLTLGQFMPKQVLTTSDWPQNEIALSKRLKKLKSQLSGAGVEVVLGKRANKRQISVTYTGISS